MKDARISVGSASNGRVSEALHVAAVTMWDGDDPRTYSPDELLDDDGRRSAQQAARGDGPVWLDLNLDSDVDRWMQPWHELAPDRTDWGPVAAMAEALGVPLPLAGSGRPGELLLRHLPQINEYAVLRQIAVPEAGGDDQPLVMPLVGLMPTRELEPRDGVTRSGFEVVLLRVNLAVVDGVLVTVRLTDRLCSGSRQHEPDRRLRAADFYEAPNLSVHARFLPSAAAPSAAGMGDAIASYLAATCSTVAETAREHMRRIEREVIAASQKRGDPRIGGCHADMLAVRAALEPIDEELLRLVQRLGDPKTVHPSIDRAKRRYLEAIRQLESVEGEIRWASDSATNQLSTFRLLEQRTEEERVRQNEARLSERQQTLERVIAGLGTALVIAALVPSLFGESVKLPNPDRAGDFIGMVLVMAGTSGVVFWALVGLLNAKSSADGSAPPGRRQRRWLTIAALLNLVAALLILAGVMVLGRFA